MNVIVTVKKLSHKREIFDELSFSGLRNGDIIPIIPPPPPHDVRGGGGPTYFFGLKIYMLGIFLGQDLSHIFLSLISKRTFHFRFSSSVNVEQKGG